MTNDSQAEIDDLLAELESLLAELQGVHSDLNVAGILLFIVAAFSFWRLFFRK